MNDKEKIKIVFLKCYRCGKVFEAETFDGVDGWVELRCPKCDEPVRLYGNPKPS